MIKSKNKIELLAPGGDIDSIKSAIIAGADAVYCGLDKFNARNRATNICFDDLQGILRLAHSHNCQVFLTLNIIFVDSEIPALIALLNKVVNTSIDGIIVQDIGLFHILSTYFKGLSIHASTQLTTHNEGQIAFLSKLQASRINLSRELNIDEIGTLTTFAHSKNILTEVFVHGSYCICFSGICYMSSVHGGNSGNRGRCSQPCRDQYIQTSAGNNFPLNLKDNSAFTNLKELADAGVDSLKIEGRIKKFHYVYIVVDAWRNQLNQLYNKDIISIDKSVLYKVFNRDFSNDFLKGTITKEMFIDNPRDNSAIHLSKVHGGISEKDIEKAKGDVYYERTEIIREVEKKINAESITKELITITISGEYGCPLKVSVNSSDKSFDLYSEHNLSKEGKQALHRELLLTRFKTVNDTEYYIENLIVDALQPYLFIPFKDLTSIKKRLFFILNNSKEFIDPIDVPVLQKTKTEVINPSLSVLLSSVDDLYLLQETSAIFYFQLPNTSKTNFTELIAIFDKNKDLIPWFPSILIGDDFHSAVEFLRTIKPKKIVTNNTGIAYEAYKMGIAWIAGPQLNSVNSYSLIALKEIFNCSGAFISNELSKIQIKGIKKPDNFELYFSLYHPNILMTSRQCFIHQVTGCTKNAMDNSCILQCEKSASITNLKNNTFYIQKSKGNYHTLFNNLNYLNTEILNDIPNIFSSFFIDVTTINTETKVEWSKLDIINHFKKYINGDGTSKEAIKQAIKPTSSVQYNKGI
jgi:U32 family peptidase